MGLGEIGEVASTALKLARGVQRDALLINAQRHRLGDKRSLPALMGAPASDRVMPREVKANIWTPERRQLPDSRTHGVGELGHRQLDGRARIACRGGGEVDAVSKQSVELIANRV